MPLDLQGVIEALFERYRYAELLDYSGPPPVPGFPLDDARWIAEQVRRWQETRSGNGVT